MISEIALSRRGLTLVTGTTGSGKSTTLASMIELINTNWPAKIIAIEDPVEYLHTPKQALITQIEVGADTPSFDQALRQSLRQDPDVILVGELRDVETLKIALRAADTGHQVISTVHSASAPQTVERIIAMFPPAEHKLLLTQLAANLEAIISQQLIICRDGVRRPACEILRGGPVPTKIHPRRPRPRAGRLHAQGRRRSADLRSGSAEMFKKELISVSEALHHASNPENLQMTLRSMGATKRDGMRNGTEARKGRSAQVEKKESAPRLSLPPVPSCLCAIVPSEKRTPRSCDRGVRQF